VAGRTFTVGDIHGELHALERVLARFPPLDARDTIVFLGDYVDRGPHSAQVLDLIRHDLPQRTVARIVPLMGNHEEAWLRVMDGRSQHFVVKAANGCTACLRSFQGRTITDDDPTADDFKEMLSGGFIPEQVVTWMRALPRWYEDEHAIYVHAGLTADGDRWLHPSESANEKRFLWERSRAFYNTYVGKPVVVGHTPTKYLADSSDENVPADAVEVQGSPYVHLIDTGCGQGGFLTAIELPAMRLYDSRP
jgi:serine/threonine protein phosphatase 1